MPLILINLTAWPAYVRLLREQMLDLHSAAAGVEAWSATAEAAAATAREDRALWGHWPRRLGPSASRLADELADRAHHLREDRTERLTVILVCERIDDLVPPPDTATPHERPAHALLRAIRDRFAASDLAAIDARITWIAAIRTGAGGTGAPAQALSLVVSGPGCAPLADLAAFLGGRDDGGDQGRRDHRTIVALRVLVDLARDEAAAERLLRPSPTTTAGRILVVTLPATILPDSPALAVRRALLALIDQARTTARETGRGEEASGIGPLAARIAAEVTGDQTVKAVASVAREPDPAADHVPDDALEAIWRVRRPESGDVWTNVTDAVHADQRFEETTESLDRFRRDRETRLAEQRRTLDDALRSVQTERLAHFEEASIDPSFGLVPSYANALDQARRTLAATVRAQSEAATRHRARRTRVLADEQPLSAAERLAGPFAELKTAIALWLPPRGVPVSAGLLAAAIGLLVWALLSRWSTTGGIALLVPASLLGIGLVGLRAVHGYRQSRERARQEATALLLDDRLKVLHEIEAASNLDLARVAAARAAGTLLPFIETLHRHARDSDRVHDLMTEVHDTLRAGLTGPSLAGAPPAAPLVAGSGSVPERFRDLLWSMPLPEGQPAEIQFDDGRSPLSFVSTQALRDPVGITFPAPSSPERGAA